MKKLVLIGFCVLFLVFILYVPCAYARDGWITGVVTKYWPRVEQGEILILMSETSNKNPGGCALPLYLCLILDGSGEAKSIKELLFLSKKSGVTIKVGVTGCTQATEGNPLAGRPSIKEVDW